MFWHRLARTIGGCTVSELRRRLTTRELAGWIYYSGLESLDPETQAAQGSIGAFWSAQAATMGKASKEPSDYMATWRSGARRKGKQTRQEMINAIRSIDMVWRQMGGGHNHNKG